MSRVHELGRLSLQDLRARWLETCAPKWGRQLEHSAMTVWSKERLIDQIVTAERSAG